MTIQALRAARYVPDPRAARNAWMVTSLIVVDFGDRPNFPAARCTAELVDVAWFHTRRAPDLELTILTRDPGGRVFGSHQGMLADVLG